ncbi:MAG: prepilin-type N-terminal cleavage/methylation domain-containing protein [Lachnospiraceae bacterium]|nr:prepilin-type N-terminal cleavage/methylation domain-containing protein [Lachnospiraceae bacterium]
MKKNNKGFTLVELIVVLVILAILAAILVPALLGYIDRAREKQYVLNAKSALTATQAELSSLYGQGKDIKDATTATDFANGTIAKNTADTPENTAFYVKTGTDTVTGTGSKAVSSNHAYYTVQEAIYYESGYYCTFTGTTWETTQTKPSVDGYLRVYGNFPTN